MERKKFISVVLLIMMLLQCMPLTIMAEDEKSDIPATKGIASVTMERTLDADPETTETTETKHDTAEKKTGSPTAVIPEGTSEAGTDAETSTRQEETGYGGSEAEFLTVNDDTGEDETDTGMPPCSEVNPENNTEGEIPPTQEETGDTGADTKTETSEVPETSVTPETSETTEGTVESGTEKGTPEMPAQPEDIANRGIEGDPPQLTETTYGAAPVVLSAATDTGGTKVLVTFDKNMEALPSAPAGFSVTVDGVDNPVTEVGLNTNNAIVELTLTNIIYSDMINIFVSYTAGTVQAADGGILAGFSDQTVTNNSTVVPSVISNITATATTATITLIWDAVPDATGYDVEADGTIVDNGTAVTYTMSGLTSNTEHIFRVRCKNGSVNGEWSSQVTKYTLLDKPLNLQYSLGDNEVTLTWDGVTGASGYKIYRNNEIIGDAVGSTAYTDSTLTQNVYYTYEVKAYTSGGNTSPKSDSVEIIWSTLPHVYITSDITLSKDTVFDYVDVYLQSGTVDLNGYKLTINGNLQQSNGTMDINGGTLEVLGNYTIGTSGPVDAYLKMVNEVDHVKVWGNFFMKSRYDHSSYLTAGVFRSKRELYSVL